MRNCLIPSIVVLAAATALSPHLLAQTGAKSGAVKAIPDLSGSWDGAPDRDSRTICGEPACRAITGVPLPRLVHNVEEPQMLPWAEQLYKSVRQGIKDPNANSHEELNPAWSGCMPVGPAQLMGGGFELQQFPDVVLLLFANDHSVRRIHMDGRGHPDNSASTYMGHSVGKYEGDALVVDTVGINDKVWIDTQGHPHTDALRMTERFRRLDHNTLEILMTFDDPKTYVKPWTKRVTHELVPPGPELWDETECEELLRIGTHFSQK